MSKTLTPGERRLLHEMKAIENNFKHLTDAELEEIEGRAVNWHTRTLDALQKVMDGWAEMQHWNRTLSDDNMRLLAEIAHLKDETAAAKMAEVK